MKAAVIFYHKNASDIYKYAWVKACVDSIRNQTMEDFDVFELNYGGGDENYCSGVRGKYVFLNRPFKTHIGAMNYLYSMLFANGYDVVFNTNMDDYYHPSRFDVQMNAIKSGYDLVSSNFCYVNNKGEVLKHFVFHDADISKELARDHNVIAHPAVCMSSRFWSDESLRFEETLGREDLDLWKKAVIAEKKLLILPDNHLYYRLHENQITKKHKA